MKHIMFVLAIIASGHICFAQNNEKQYYYTAKKKLEDMLNGKEKASYEKAVFLLENAWHSNQIRQANFDSAISYHLQSIQQLIEANYNEDAIKKQPDWFTTKDQLIQQYKKALTNWAIYTYMTHSDIQNYRYSHQDPMATKNWENTQVIHLNNTGQGNCFALASMFKILANRLESGAKLCTAPSHIYIAHEDEKGVQYNIELGSKNFPGTGAINAITYSTDNAIQSGIAQRELTQQQEIALLLVYLAKGYEHKFYASNDPFILQCAEMALQYDTKNLNALLLKREFLENKLIASKQSVSELQLQPDFMTYQDLLKQLYNLGYREMPLQMKNTLVKLYNKEKIETVDKQLGKDKNGNMDKVATVSWGLFDERRVQKPIERYGNTLFDTKAQKVLTFAREENLYNNYTFDPAVFALNIDPLTYQFPSESPYLFAGNSPILYVDKEGLKKYHYQRVIDERTGNAVLIPTKVETVYKTVQDGWAYNNRANGWGRYPIYKTIEDTKDQFVVHQTDRYFEQFKMKSVTVYEDEWATFDSYGEASNATDKDFNWTSTDSKMAWAQGLRNAREEMEYQGGAGGMFYRGSRGYTVDPKKFDYFFGRVIEGAEHNVMRSAQNLKDLTTLGIKTEGQLMSIFDQAINMNKGVVKVSQYGTTVTKTVQVGEAGAIDVSFFYKAGTRFEATAPSVTTIIPKLAKSAK